MVNIGAHGLDPRLGSLQSQIAEQSEALGSRQISWPVVMKS
jgi:hypothetical protein